MFWKIIAAKSYYYTRKASAINEFHDTNRLKESMAAKHFHRRCLKEHFRLKRNTKSSYIAIGKINHVRIIDNQEGERGLKKSTTIKNFQ